MDVRNDSDETSGHRRILADIHKHTLTTLTCSNHLEYNYSSAKENKTD